MTWSPKTRKHATYAFTVPRGVSERELIQREAKVGAQIFGYLPPNRRREFFCLDPHTWVWHEEWQDHAGPHQVTTRYEIHGKKVLKLQNDQSAELVTGEELTNLYQAVMAYYRGVAAEVYKRPVAEV